MVSKNKDENNIVVIKKIVAIIDKKIYNEKFR